MMRKTRFLLSALTAASLGALVNAQTTGYSERFPSPGINGRIFGLGTWNGRLYAGGPFDFQAAGGRLPHLARFDGRSWRDVGGGTDGPVRAIASYGGELVVAGAFSSAGGVSTASIARWNGSRWAPFGSGFSATGGVEVFALAVFQGELYAGGRFDSAGGQPIDTLARWDGSRWRAVGGGLGGPWDRKVLSLHADGATLYVGGEFDTAGGQPAKNVAAWDGTSWSSLGTGLGAAVGDGVHALATFLGDLYAGGNFRTAGGVTTLKIARWNGSSWGPVGLGIPDSSISVQVNALEVLGQDLYVCGSFGEVDATSRGAGIFAQGVARWDGNAWHPLVSGGGGLFRNAFGGQTYGIAAVVYDGRLVVGGDFEHAGPVGDHVNNVVSHDVVAWDGSRFSEVGEGLGGGGSKSVAWNGSIWTVGGGRYAGTAVSPHIARFDGARWHVVGPLDPRSDVDDVIVFQGNLHVVGTLRFVGGPTLSGVVRFDGVSWTSLGGPTGGVLAVYNNDLYVGGLGFLRRYAGGSWTALPSFFGYVNAMQAFGGKLYVGGSNLGTTPGSPVNMMVWDGASLLPVGGGLDGSVGSLHEHAGELWIGGGFTNAGTTTSPRLVRWDGSQFLAFPGSVSGTVGAMATLLGDLCIAGNLGVIGGVRTSLARWDGTRLTALGAGTDFPATHLLPDDVTGTLWITGGFTRAGDQTSHGIANWHGTPRWVDLGEALPGTGGAPLLEAFGSLVGPDVVAFRMSAFGANAPVLPVFGTRAVNAPLQGGLLVPRPDVTLLLFADAAGRASWNLQVPAGLPAGIQLYSQAWSLESGSGRIISSNAVYGRR